MWHIEDYRQTFGIKIKSNYWTKSLTIRLWIVHQKFLGIVPECLTKISSSSCKSLWKQAPLDSTEMPLPKTNMAVMLPRPKGDNLSEVIKLRTKLWFMISCRVIPITGPVEETDCESLKSLCSHGTVPSSPTSSQANCLLHKTFTSKDCHTFPKKKWRTRYNWITGKASFLICWF